MSTDTRQDIRSDAPPADAVGRTLTPAGWWALVVATLALAASLAGLVLDGVYSGAASTAEMLRGFDVVTVAVVPALVGVTLAARRGSVLARLISLSLVAYLLYTYAYYLFGTGFNDLFLLHAAVLATGIVALVLGLAGLDVAALTRRCGSQLRARGAAAVLGVLALALGGMWVYVALDNALTGATPTGSRLVETDTVVHLGMALDLALLVPLYAASAILLWRGSTWGHVLGTIALLAGILHQMSYLVALPFQAAAGVPGAVSFDAGEPVIVLLYLLGAGLLLGSGRAGGPVRQ